MRPFPLRKTLIALSITAALPVHGATLDISTELDLTDQDLDLIKGSLDDGLEIHGTHDDRIENFRVAKTMSGDIKKDLIFNATLHSQNIFSFYLTQATIENNFIINGRITVEGDPSNLSIEDTTVGGDFINNGLLSAHSNAQPNARALEITNYSHIKGHLSNTLGASISAQGSQAKALSLSDSQLDGDLINHGLIEAIGEQSTAIHIGADTDNATHTALHIRNSGTLSGGTNAIDASDATQAVRLTLGDGSVVSGNLLNLEKIDVLGNVHFSRPDQEAVIRLAANGSVDIGNANDAGHLQLGQHHTLLEGDLNMAAGSSLAVVPIDPTQSSLTVTGTAVFEQGSQIRLDTQSSRHEFSTSGSHFTLLKAGTLDDRGLTVSLGKRSPLLQSSINIDAPNHSVLAQIALKSEAQIADLVGERGANRNSQQALVRLAHDGVLSKLQEQDRIFSAFSSADEQQLAVLSAQLAPEVNGSASQAATSGQALISNTTSNRTSSIRGLSSGDPLTGTGVWVQGLSSDATQNARDGVEGYKANSSGMSVGADGKLNEQLTLGVAYSLLDTDVKSQNGNTTRVESHAFSVYGGYEHGRYFVDANLTAGLNTNQGKRHIAGTTAKSSYDSTLLGLDVTGGYTYPLTDRLDLEPRLSARYNLVDIDGYREKGSSAALKLKEQRFTALEVGAGLRVAANYPLGKGTIRPQAKLMYYQDLLSDKAETTSTFVQGNTPFVTHGTKAPRSSYEAGVGADYQLGAVTLGLNYDHVAKSDFSADTFTAKVRYDF